MSNVRHALTAITLCLALAVPTVAHAQSYEAINNPVNLRMNYQVGQQMLSNAPLPLLYLNKGDYKITVQPYYIKGKLGDTSTWTAAGGIPVTEHSTGSFDGWGGAINASYSWKDHWGLYAQAFGNQLTGNFEEIETRRLSAYSSDLSDATFSTKLNDSRSSMVALGTGIVYGTQFKDVPMSFWAGPSVAIFHSSARDPGNAGFTPYRVVATQVLPGMAVGAQAGFPVGSFMLNPFASVNPVFAVIPSKVGITPEAGSPGQLTPQSPTEKTYVVQTSTFVSVGLNLVYRPWNLSFNLTAPFITKPLIPYTSSQFGAEVKYPTARVMLFSVAYSFGKYQK